MNFEDAKMLLRTHSELIHKMQNIPCRIIDACAGVGNDCGMLLKGQPMPNDNRIELSINYMRQISRRADSFIASLEAIRDQIKCDIAESKKQ